MAILALDSFLRATASGLGTGSDGQPWNLVNGAGTYAIAGADHIVSNAPSVIYGDHGSLTGANTVSTQFYGSKTASALIQKCRFAISKNTASTFGLLARASGPTTFYRAEVQSNLLVVHSVAAGKGTLLASVAFPLTLGVQYWLQFFVGEGTPVPLFAAVWQDGTAYPGWLISTQDTNNALPSAGQFGLTCNPNGLSEMITFDSYSVTDGVIPPSFANDSPYGFSIFEHASQPLGNNQWSGTTPADLPTQMYSDFKTLQGSSPTIWMRYSFRWHDIEQNPTQAVSDPPTNTAIYDPTSLAVYDNTVAQCNALGINLLAVIQDSPTNYQIWNDDGTVAPNSGSPPQSTGVVAPASSYRRFARFIADRYNGLTGHGTIQAMQQGNEEFDTYQGRTGQALIPVANACYPMIQATYPGIYTGICSVRKTPTQAQTHITTWCNTVFSGIGSNADWVDAHYYRDGTCTPDPDVSCSDSSQTPNIATEIRLISSALSAAGYPGRPIHINECGWGVGLPVNDPSMVNAALFGTINDLTLAAALVSGSTYTQLAVSALQQNANAGDMYAIVSGGGVNTQVVTLSQNAAANATTLYVQSFQANYSYPKGTSVDSLAITSTTQLTFSLVSGGGATFPVSNFLLLIDNECILVASRSGDTLTVAAGGRGYAGTTAAVHDCGTQANLATMLTQAMQSEYIQEMYNAAGQSAGAVTHVLVWTLDDTQNATDNILNTYQAFTDIKTYIALYPHFETQIPSVLFPAVSRRDGQFPAAIRRDGLVPAIARRG